MKSSRAPSRAGSAGAPRGRAREPRRAAPLDALALARRAAGGDFPPTLYLEGPSEALKAECLASIRRAWATRTPEAPIGRVLRAAESSVEEILALYQGASLFQPRDLILVLDIEDLGRSEKKVAALAAGLASPAGETCLVLVESAADQPRRSLDSLRAACATTVVALPPDRADLLAWGAFKLVEHGLTAAPGVIEAIAAAGDGDALAFFGELSRLSAWAPRGTPVTTEDVARLMRPVVGAELPDYLAAVAAGETRLAARRLGRLLAAGVGEGSILFALSNLVGGALGGWARDRGASERLKIRRGGVQLVQALDAVYRAESAWKGGRGDVVALLEQATRDVCGAV